VSPILLLLQQGSDPYSALTARAPMGHPSFNGQLPSGGGFTMSATAAIPTGRWTCIEIHVTLAQSGVARYSVDGVEIGDATLNANLAPAPPFGLMKLGYLMDYTDNAMPVAVPELDVWVDDVWVAQSPIGCTQ
jgi:hypothetical protein